MGSVSWATLHSSGETLAGLLLLNVCHWLSQSVVLCLFGQTPLNALYLDINYVSLVPSGEVAVVVSEIESL